MSHGFLFRGPAGRLEATITEPAGEAVAAAVVCHAHPLFGGMMHFKPVFRAARALRSRGLAALRFNFRGVGRSEGVHDEGRGEQDDVRAALDEVARRHPGKPLVLGGFSFGAVMALRVACDETRVGAVFALGFPVTTVPDPSFLDRCRKPRLFVQGAEDGFGGAGAIRPLVEALAPPRELLVVEGADHLFEGRLDALEAAVGGWAARRPWEG